MKINRPLFTVRCSRLRLCFFWTIIVVAAAACAPRQLAWEPRPAGQAEAQLNREGFGGVYHEVKAGQTLWRIATTYRVDLETLQWVNDVEDVTDLRIGRILFVPGVNKVMEIEPYRPGDEIPSSQKISIIWPMSGRTSSRYGPRGDRDHQGIDLAAATGTPVKAAAEGKVAYSGDGMKGYGKVVVIKHASELSTVYAHNSKLLVRMGERVEQGQVIARVGQTGWATGPHLHFEVRRRGVPEDPMDFLSAP
ncbi:MAG: LysM peptidoglycan-binding domain-containing M23 family metallopeptidase [bacterium]|nr:LysM peptidoglycan-binding domain-containing M23 family metallopeptidase [bacterium]